MPLVSSGYFPPRFLRHGHLATILSSFRPAPGESWTGFERLELPDGDFLDVAWNSLPMAPGSASPRPLVILCHGLEGSIRASYIRSMGRTFARNGWDVLAWNYRSCGGIPNRLLRSYHSGETGDLGHVIRHAARTHSRMVLTGFSLGGNIVLKYAGEAPPHPAVLAAIAISAPVDLASCARALDGRRGNRWYLRRFLKTLLAKTAAKSRQFPGSIDAACLARIRTIRAFDDAITAPLHGFASAEDYWARASALPVLAHLTIPSLLLNAGDDPLLDLPCYPAQAAAAHPWLHLETPAHGGHVGFPDFRQGGQPWYEHRILEFLKSHAAGSFPADSAQQWNRGHLS